MKIGPPPPPPPAERAALPAGEPARDFADYLGEAPARAAGFAELGMFGLTRAQAAPRPVSVRPVPAGAAGPPSTLPVPETEASGAPPVGVGDVPAGKGTPLPSDAPAICALPRAAPAKAGTAEICSLPGEATGKVVEIESCEGPQAPPRAVRLRLLQAGRDTGITLALREQDGAVEIFTRAPRIDPETRAQLRRLVEAILARSGLRLAQFKLNGAPVAPDSLGRIGGRHGTRTG